MNLERAASFETLRADVVRFGVERVFPCEDTEG